MRVLEFLFDFWVNFVVNRRNIFYGFISMSRQKLEANVNSITNFLFQLIATLSCDGEFFLLWFKWVAWLFWLAESGQNLLQLFWFVFCENPYSNMIVEISKGLICEEKLKKMLEKLNRGGFKFRTLFLVFINSVLDQHLKRKTLKHVSEITFYLF